VRRPSPSQSNVRFSIVEKVVVVFFVALLAMIVRLFPIVGVVVIVVTAVLLRVVPEHPVRVALLSPPFFPSHRPLVTLVGRRWRKLLLLKIEAITIDPACRRATSRLRTSSSS
jgi:hypothetical protein